jgi:hypothetical protein
MITDVVETGKAGAHSLKYLDLEPSDRLLPSQLRLSRKLNPSPLAPFPNALFKA